MIKIPRTEPLFAAILFMAAACSDTQEDIVTLRSTAIPNHTQSIIRTPNEALGIANKAVGMFTSPTESRAANFSKKIDYNKGVIVCGSGKQSRSEKDTLMYAVNYCDNQGFVLVSAVRSTPEVIAYVPNGTYVDSIEIENPGFKFFINKANEYLANEKNTLSIGEGNTTIKPYLPIWAPIYKEFSDTTITVDIPNRVQVFWGQSGAEGAECPNQTSGCSITAAAMAMTYFKYPGSITLTYKENTPELILDWQKMCKHKDMDSYHSGYYYDDTCDAATHVSISQLCRELGKRANTLYIYDNNGRGISPTSTSNLVQALRKIGYRAFSEEYSSQNVINALQNQNCVLLMCGVDEARNVGHMWVCDGVKSKKIHRVSYESKDGGMTWHQYFEKTEYLTYNYYKWGWNYSNCGYFISDCFDPSSAIESPTTSRANNSSNVYFIKMIK